MNTRAFLIRGLLAGLLAGLATFAVAYVVGEPSVNQAIAIEEAGSEPATAPLGDHGHAEDVEAAHSHDAGAAVSRTDQSTWGLLTGTATVGVTLGGLVALVAAGAMGRMVRLSPAASTAAVGAIGYVSVALVPFVKYPATPPAVGDGDTIGQRTVLYFTFAAISLAAAAASTVLAARLVHSLGPRNAVVAGAGTYVAVVVLAGSLMPTVNEIGGFPGDVLWDFRLASMLTLTVLWVTISLTLSASVRRLDQRHRVEQARREFAASL